MNLCRVHYLAMCSAVAVCIAHGAAPSEILVSDAKSQPESLTMAPGGVLIVGSSSSPFIYKVPAGSSTAEKFIDASAEGTGTFFYGVLSDPTSNTLWTCQPTPVAGSASQQKHSKLRGFDLTTGTPKLSWKMPGEDSTCNDLSIGPDKALYFTDTSNGRIFKLPVGSSAAELYVDDRLLMGIEGITFLGGILYVNNVFFSKLYRIPVDNNGKPGHPIDNWVDQPVRGPDGILAANGKIYLAEIGMGVVCVLTVNGERANVRVLKDGLNRPTGIEPVRDTLWFTERAIGKAESIKMPQ